MGAVVAYEHEHLEQLTALVNMHVSAVVPGWWLPEEYLASRLRRNPGEAVVDPWVAERESLIAVGRHGVVGGLHLLRFGDEARVGPTYRGVVEVDWLVVSPAEPELGRTLLAAGLERAAARKPASVHVASNLYLPCLGGVPDCWPHVGALLREHGFEPDVELEESIWLGRLDTAPPPGPPPLRDLRVERSVGPWSARFSAVLDGREVGIFDPGQGGVAAGRLPCLAGWVDPWNLSVEEGFRGRGIGTWLVAVAVEWLRLGGFDRIVLPVARGDEERGAGRFYERLGFRKAATLTRGWTLPAATIRGR